MNSVELVGRLVRDPEQKNNVTSFTIAVNRPTKPGEEKKADFIKVAVFNRQGEVCAQYLKKGRLVGAQGSIRTGAYEGKDGRKVSTTEVWASNVEFLDTAAPKPEQKQQDFEALDEDTPF